MEVKKEPKFRVTIMDMKTKKVRVVTIYTDKKIELDEFKERLVGKIKEIE